jgi:hypothetical protein
MIHISLLPLLSHIFSLEVFSFHFYSYQKFVESKSFQILINYSLFNICMYEISVERNFVTMHLCHTI